MADRILQPVLTSSIVLAACITAAIGPDAYSAQPAEVDEFANATLASLPLEGENPQARPTVPERPYPTTAPTTDTPTEPSPYLLGDFGGHRSRLESSGLTVAPSLTLDVGRNLRGGLDTAGSSVDGLLDLAITFDTEAATLWNGGTFFVDFQAQRGDTASDEVGDYQGISNIASDGRTQLSEAWYQHVAFDGLLAVKVGKIDVNGDFGFAEHAGAFVNGSMGFPLSNLLMPTYPDPAFGAALFVNPTDAFYISGGVFDGALAEGISTGERGPRTLFDAPADLYLIAETGYLWTFADGTLPGRVRLGCWHHTGTFDQFDGDTQDGVGGGYVIVDQRLWRENPGVDDDVQGIVGFVEFDAGDRHVLEVRHHWSAGLTWTGAIPTRDADVIGVGVTRAHFNGDAGFAGGDEVTCELFYQLQITPAVTVKPDLQYVVNPGGTGDLSDALVALVRIEIAF